jgi:putative endopeptidase
VGAWVVWNADVNADLKEGGTYAMYLDASGTGLDRELYVDPKQKQTIDSYKGHVAKMLALAGTPQAKSEAAAADVIAIETDIAKVSRTAAERGDDVATYNAVDQKALAKQTKSIDWKTYWKALGAEPSTKLVVRTPKLFAAIDRLRAKYKPAQWTNYFTFHIVQKASLAIGKPFADQAFDLERALTGVEKAPERSKRCIEATQVGLGELIGQQFAVKFFPGQSKQTATMLVEALARAVGDEITRVDWMAEATKQTAISKLTKVVKMIGYPDKWRTYDFEVKRDDFAGNSLRAWSFDVKRRLGRWGKPVDRSEWQLNTFSTVPYYDYKSNSAVLPAGVLQPPFFGQDRSIAANLGGIASKPWY